MSSLKKRKGLNTAKAAAKYAAKRKEKALAGEIKPLAAKGKRGKRLAASDRALTASCVGKTCEYPGLFGHVCGGRVDPHHIINKDECPEDFRNEPINIVYVCRTLHDLIHAKRKEFNEHLGERYDTCRQLSLPGREWPQ